MVGQDRAVDAVIFDLGLTLVRYPRERIMADLLRRRGVSVTERRLAAAYYRVDRYYMREHPGLLAQNPRTYYPGYLRRLFAELELDLDPDEVTQALFSGPRPRADWQPYPETRAVLETLRDRGYRLGLISNWDRSGPDTLARLGLDRLLETALFSAIEGVAKPDPEIFLRAAGRLGVPPSRVLYVGDNYHDDAPGALAAGCRFVLIDRLPDVDPGETWDCPVVHDLWGVVDYLEGPGGAGFGRVAR
ncbi:MAG TPA: HAD-IA family hydrolase [Bacillota bacterium]